MASVGEVWWQPSAADVAGAAETKLRLAINARYGYKLEDYQALHRFSISQPTLFWDACWDHFGVIGEKGPKVRCHDAATLIRSPSTSAIRWAVVSR